MTRRALYNIYRCEFNPILAGLLALIGRAMNEQTQVEVFEFRGKPVDSYVPKTKIIFEEPPRRRRTSNPGV